MYEAVALCAFVAYAASLAIRYRSLPVRIPQSFRSNSGPVTWPRWSMWAGVVLIGIIDALTVTGTWSAVRAHPNTSWMAVTVLTLFAAWTTRMQGDVAVGKCERPAPWVSWAFLIVYFVTITVGPRLIG